PCASSASPTPSLPRTWASCARSNASTAKASPPRPPSHEPKPGAPGAPMRPYTCGRPLQTQLQTRRKQMAVASHDRYTLSRVKTPIGVALLLTDARERLAGLDWDELEARLVALFRSRFGDGAELREGPPSEPSRGALAHYFDGDVHAIDGLACAAGGTAFQRT